jgi:hypothetical protein
VAIKLDASIQHATSGLINLQTTYANDSTTVATVGLLIAKLQEISSSMQSMDTNTDP